QEPLREACPRRVRERETASKPGVDFENTNLLVVDDRLETKRPTRAGKNLSELIGDPLKSRMVPRRSLGDLAGPHVAPHMRNGAAQPRLAIEEDVHGILLTPHAFLHDVVLGELGKPHRLRTARDHRPSRSATDPWLQYQRPLPIRRVEDFILERGRTRHGN